MGGFLKKFGEIVVKGLQIATGIVPYAAPVIAAIDPAAAPIVTAVSNDLATIAGIVQNVEVMGASLGLSGPDKLKAASPQVAQIILSSALLVNHKIADGPKFTQGVNAIASGMADVLSSLEDKVPTTDKAA